MHNQTKSSLDALLTLRQREEESALLCYQRAACHVIEVERTLSTAEAQLAAGWKESKGIVQQAAFSIHDLRRVQTYCEMVEQRCKEWKRSTELARQGLAEALGRWVAARQATQVLERYLQNQRTKVKRRQQQKEQKTLDDLAGMRARTRSLITS